jgi:hypothetical protein
VKKITLILLLFFVLIGVAHAGSTNYYQYINLDGYVFDDNNNPIEGARVWVVNDTCTIQLLGGDLNVTTDSNGYYKLPTFSMFGTNCDVHLHIQKDGYLSVDGYIHLTPAQTNNITTNYSLSSTLKVEVYDINGDPLSIGRVTADGLSATLNNGVAYLPVSTVPVDIGYVDDSGVYNNYTHKDVSWDLNSQHVEVFNDVTKHANLSTSVTSNLTKANLGDTVVITATITNGDSLTADAENVNATVSFSPAGCARLANGENATKSLGTLSGGATKSVSWNLIANQVSSNCRINVTPDGIDSDIGTNAYSNPDSVVLDVTNKYTVIINEPNPSGNYSEGQDIPMNVTVLDANNRIVVGANVTVSGNGSTAKLSSVGDHTGNYYYVGNFSTNDSFPNNLKLTVTASKAGNVGSASVEIHLQNHANLSIVNMTTNLPRGVYCNRNQTYELNVTIKNNGEVTAKDVNITLSSSVGSNITLVSPSMPFDLSGGSSQDITFSVTCANVSTVPTNDTLTAFVRGYDEYSGKETNDSASINITIQKGAGGDDKKLNVTIVSITPNVINATGMQANVTVNVTNDGDAPANDTSLAITIWDGGSCSSGNNVTDEFNITRLSPADVNSTKPYTFKFNVSANHSNTPTSGNYTICISANGVDGNDGTNVGSNEASKSFVVDADVPQIELISPLNVSSNNATFSFIVIDKFNATALNARVYVLNSTRDVINSTSMTVGNGTVENVTFTLQGEGNYSWYVIASDGVNINNSSASIGVQSFVVDTTNPVVKIISPNNSIEGTPVEFKFELNETNPGYCMLHLYNASGSLVRDFNIINLTSGNHTYNYLVPGNASYNWDSGNYTWNMTCVDEVGNNGSSNSLSFEVDADYPTIHIISPTNDLYLNSGNVTVKWNGSDATSGIEYYLVSNDSGATWTNVSSNTSYNITGLSDGTHTVVVKAIDKVGHESNASVSFTVDTVAPDVNITNPANGTSTTSHTITIRWNGSDNTQIDHYELQIDGNNVWSGNATSYTKTFSDGTHTIIVKAVDKAGNPGNDTVTFSVYTSHTGYTGGGGGGAPTGGAGAKVNVTVYPKEVSLSLGETKEITVTVINNGTSYLADMSVSLRGLPSGNYNFDKTTFSLASGESITITLTLNPLESLKSGKYKVRIEASNNFAGNSDTFTFVFNNTKEADAVMICENASSYISKLKSNGTNVSTLESNYSSAMSYIDEGKYSEAISLCNDILAYTSGKTNPATRTTPSGITGFFIAAGKFTMDNAVWISLAIAIAIIAYLSRGMLLAKLRKKPPISPSGVISTGNNDGGDGGNSEENSGEDKVYMLVW